MKNLIIIIATVMMTVINTNILHAQSSDVDQFEVKVDGLGCPFCAYGLEKKFNELKEIEGVSIEMETGMMTFSYPTSEMLTAERVEQQVDAAGYTAVHVKVVRADESIEESAPAQMAEVDESQLMESTFFVAGNCGMCKARIEKTAKSVAGIKDAEWNKKTNMLTVNFDKSQTSKEEIEKMIAGAGHDTHTVKADDTVYNELPGCCQYDREN